MRLCGHDCVVSDRYDSGSVGSGRYFYRLDPQDPLNFGRNLLSLSINAAPGRYPRAGMRIGTLRVHADTCGTGEEQICNARVHAIVYRSRSVAIQSPKWHKTGRQGGAAGSTLGSTKRGRRNATAQPCEASPSLTRSDRHNHNRNQSDNWHNTTPDSAPA